MENGNENENRSDNLFQKSMELGIQKGLTDETTDLFKAIIKLRHVTFVCNDCGYKLCDTTGIICRTCTKLVCNLCIEKGHNCIREKIQYYFTITDTDENNDRNDITWGITILELDEDEDEDIKTSTILHRAFTIYNRRKNPLDIEHFTFTIGQLDSISIHYDDGRLENWNYSNENESDEEYLHGKIGYLWVILTTIEDGNIELTIYKDENEYKQAYVEIEQQLILDEEDEYENIPEWDRQ